MNLQLSFAVTLLLCPLSISAMSSDELDVGNPLSFQTELYACGGCFSFKGSYKNGQKQYNLSYNPNDERVIFWTNTEWTCYRPSDYYHWASCTSSNLFKCNWMRWTLNTKNGTDGYYKYEQQYNNRSVYKRSDSLYFVYYDKSKWTLSNSLNNTIVYDTCNKNNFFECEFVSTDGCTLRPTAVTNNPSPQPSHSPTAITISPTRRPTRTPTRRPTHTPFEITSYSKYLIFNKTSYSGWERAEAICKYKWDTHLATIITVEDWAEARSMIYRAGFNSTDAIWIGLNDENQDGVWQWIDANISCNYTSFGLCTDVSSLGITRFDDGCGARIDSEGNRLTPFRCCAYIEVDTASLNITGSSCDTASSDYYNSKYFICASNMKYILITQNYTRHQASEQKLTKSAVGGLSF